MPSRAKAKTVFFCVSVASTFSFAPVRWVSVMSPESETLTLRSVSSCLALLRSTRTRRTSALP
jgi:hypothetical protein